MVTRLTDDELARTLAVMDEVAWNQTHAAERLGVSRSTLQYRLKELTARGMHPGIMGGTLPPGLSVNRITTLHTTEDGRVQQWVQAKADPRMKGDPVPTIQAAFEGFKGKAFIPPPVGPTTDQLLTVYVLSDLHLGMYSWKMETGNDYDVDIADRIFTGVMLDLIDRVPPTEDAVLLNLGDFFHSDNNENRTLRSGNALDVDTRYARVMQAGTDLVLNAVHLMLQKHRRVTYRGIPGNHDPYGALALTLALKAYFHGHERVTIDDNPGPFWWYKFGRVMLGAAHGDMAKPHQLINIMAAKAPELWGSTDFRYAYLGHIHKRTKGGVIQLGGELGGAIWETFQTIAPRDAWGNSMGFTAGRSMQAIVHHKEKGEWDRKTSPVKGAP